MTGDERETLAVLMRRPANIPVLIERLGLSGSTAEVLALCESLDGLVERGYAELDPSPGWSTYRWRVTAFGRASAESVA